MNRKFVLVTLFTLMAMGGVVAQVPRQISYQGILTDANGVIVPDGNHALALSLYDAATGGTALFSESHDVVVKKGVFNIIMGSKTPLPPTLSFDRAYFLGVAVDGAAELSPRTALTASPYSLHATSASTAQFADSSRTAASANVARGLLPGASGVVTSLNGQSGAIQLVGSGSTTVSSSGGQFTISSTMDNSGIAELRTTNGTLQITDAEGPLTTINVAPGGISARELAENSVGSLAITDGAITTRKLANEVFEEPKIAPGAVTASKLGLNAVTAPKIADGAVTTAKLADASVTGAKFNTTGAVSGQALIYDGSKVGFAFPSAGALSLPYSQTASNPSPLFSITNSGAGGAGNFAVSGAGGGTALTGSTAGSGTAVLGLQTGGSGRAGYFQSTSSANNTNTLEATTAGSTGTAILGTATGGNGVSGVANTGNGVNATSTSGNGLNATSTGGSAVNANSTNGSGVNAASTSGRAGVFTITNSGNANAALDASTTGTGNGISGLSTSGFGIVGRTASTARAGTVGTMQTTFNYLSNSGVAGYSPNSYGVSGVSETGLAVLGYANGAGAVAGYFFGNVTVTSNATITGTLAKGAGTFKIDHPLDPANKFLYHSFVESPDMMNIYNGNAILDGSGSAEVTMPEWFSVLNMEFRYQLTAVGAPGPNLHVAEKINGNRFRIAGGAPGMEVSWQVTGIRQDPYAKAHRVQVEVQKSDKERGRYLHPDLYNQPRENAIYYIPPPVSGQAGN